MIAGEIFNIVLADWGNSENKGERFEELGSSDIERAENRDDLNGHL